jgi:phage/plasmid-associated DNA primase
LTATEAYRAEADELADFIAARCVVGDPSVFRVSRADLAAAYVAWAREASERNALERNALYEAIRRRDGIVEDKWKVSGTTVRGFKGIALVATDIEGGR